MRQNNNSILAQFIFIGLYTVIMFASFIGLEKIHWLLALTVLFIANISVYHYLSKSQIYVLTHLDDSIEKLNRYINPHYSPPINKSRLSFFKLTKAIIETTDEFDQALNLTIDSINESHDSIKKLERITYLKANTLNTLLLVGKQDLLDENIEDYYQIILTSAIKVIEKADKGSILVLNELTNTFNYVTCIGYDQEALSKISLKLEETFIYKSTEGHYDQPHIISSVSDYDYKSMDEGTYKKFEDSGGLDLCEALSAPIFIDGKLYAILNIDSTLPNAFTEIDVDLIQFFTSQISVALKNKLLMNEMIKLSKYDKLTGAYNRNYFEDIFDSHKRTILSELEPYSIVLCDLNYLKLINDNFGHIAGDEILIAFSKIIMASISTDTIFARVGGDEFLILFKGLDKQSIQSKMASIHAQFTDKWVNHNGYQLPISFSYGIASSPEDSMIYDVLFKIADMRMYEFKNKFKLEHPELLKSLGIQPL